MVKRHKEQAVDERSEEYKAVVSNDGKPMVQILDMNKRCKRFLVQVVLVMLFLVELFCKSSPLYSMHSIHMYFCDYVNQMFDDGFGSVCNSCNR